MQPTENKQQEPLKGLARRSQEVEEVLGKMPGWMLRWGLTATALLVAALVAVAALFRYPDLKPLQVTIATGPAPAELLAPCDGLVVRADASTGAALGANDTVLVLLSDSGTRRCVAAGAAGGELTLYRSCAPGTRVRKGETLGVLVPRAASQGHAARHAASPRCHGYTTESDRFLLRIGQEVSVDLPRAASGTHALLRTDADGQRLRGIIAALSPRPDEQGRYYFEIRLIDPLPPHAFSAAQLQATAYVAGPPKSLLQRIWPHL